MKYIFEFFIVAFGVVLALLLTEWNNQRKIDNNTEQTLEFLILELNANIEKFQNAVDYHQLISSDLDSVAKRLTSEDLEKIYYSNKVFKHYNLPHWKGLGTVEPEDIVFESAKISGVFQELNIPTTRLISNAYKRMQLYNNFSRKIFDEFQTINSATRVIDVIRLLEIIKTDIINFEKYLSKELMVTKNNLELLVSEREYKK